MKPHNPMAHKLVLKHNRQQTMKWERTLEMKKTKQVSIKKLMSLQVGVAPIHLQAEVV
jgi:hypothetical protein